MWDKGGMDLRPQLGNKLLGISVGSALQYMVREKGLYFFTRVSAWMTTELLWTSLSCFDGDCSIPPPPPFSSARAFFSPRQSLAAADCAPSGAAPASGAPAPLWRGSLPAKRV